jgi:hypothetical protein
LPSNIFDENQVFRVDESGGGDNDYAQSMGKFVDLSQKNCREDFGQRIYTFDAHIKCRIAFCFAPNAPTGPSQNHPS